MYIVDIQLNREQKISDEWCCHCTDIITSRTRSDFI